MVMIHTWRVIVHYLAAKSVIIRCLLNYTRRVATGPHLSFFPMCVERILKLVCSVSGGSLMELRFTYWLQFHQPCPPFPIPVLLFTKPINTCNQLLSNDIWRMWQVNIFCHFTALLGNWLILHKGFSELYDEGSHESRPCTYCCCESSLNKHRLLI